MPRMIDQIRASKLPSNMMQFAARGALQVPPAENIEILVHLARHNHVFGDLARLTLAGWDEKASLAVAGDPQSPREVLDYFISPDNLRPKLLPALLENPAISEGQLMKIAIGASRDTIQMMLKSPRVRLLSGVLAGLQANPYLEKEQADELRTLLSGARQMSTTATAEDAAPAVEQCGGFRRNGSIRCRPPQPATSGRTTRRSPPISRNTSTTLPPRATSRSRRSAGSWIFWARIIFRH